MDSSNRISKSNDQTPEFSLDSDSKLPSSSAIQSQPGAKRKYQKPPRVQFIEGGERSEAGKIPQLQLPDADLQDEPSLTNPLRNVKTDNAALSAQTRARRLESKLSVSSATSPKKAAVDGEWFEETRKIDKDRTDDLYNSPPLRPLSDHPVKLDDIPLENLRTRRPYDIDEDTTDDDSDVEEERTLRPEYQDEHSLEARRLVRTFTQGMGSHERQRANCTTATLLEDPEYHNSGATTPAIDKRLYDLEYVPPPQQYKPSVLSSILFAKLANYERGEKRRSVSAGPQSKHRSRKSSKSPGIGSGMYTPDRTSYFPSPGQLTPGGKKPKWYDKSPSNPVSRGSMSSSTATLLPEHSRSHTPNTLSARPAFNRTRSTNMIATAVDMITHSSSKKARAAAEFNDHVVQLEVQLSDILARRKYLLKLCRALMIFGAPTHRLEEYMHTSARKLLVQGSFQYLPNCMVVSFDDPDTHTTEVHLVKETAALDLGKFKDTFNVYKNIIHDKYTALQALEEINQIMERKKLFPNWLLIIIYGVAAVTVGPFAFNARPMDFPICFLLGSILGCLQLLVVPKSAQFSHVFEVLACVVITFAARGFGSIKYGDNYVFCFSAITQSSIALILPGWIVLCAAQELQSRNIIAGSIRMVYAIIYTLLLGFGMVIGTTLMGLIYPAATDTITCHTPWWWDGTTPRWRATYVNFIWVPIFTICLAMVNQARWRQMIPMTIISMAGYTTNYFASIRFAQNIQIANACGAFVVGMMANLYSRFFHGLAAATMLPAIFVQVPSGLAASGSLVAALTSANQITRNSSSHSIVSNGTQGFLDAQNASTSQFGYSPTSVVSSLATAASLSSSTSTSLSGGTIFDVGYGMVQVAIGISVGLFLSALFIYPVNKRRSGLFSF